MIEAFTNKNFLDDEGYFENCAAVAKELSGSELPTVVQIGIIYSKFKGFEGYTNSKGRILRDLNKQELAENYKHTLAINDIIMLVSASYTESIAKAITRKIIDDIIVAKRNLDDEDYMMKNLSENK